MFRGEETLATTVGALAFSLDPVLGEWFVTIIVAVLAVVGTWTASRIQHRGKPEHAMIDQMQEELSKMRRRMDRFEARDRVYIPHILKLNHHIETGQGPPAPAIPRVILDYLAAEEDEG